MLYSWWEYKKKHKPPKTYKEIILVCIWKEFTHLTILFLTAGKKKKAPALSQGSLILALRISPNLLIAWQRHEWRQLRKTSNQIRQWRIDDVCCLHSWFYFHSWGANYWWWRNFCKAGLSLPLIISSLLFKQEGAFNIFKNDTFLLWCWCLIFPHDRQQLPAPPHPLHHCLPAEMLQPSRKERSRLPRDWAHHHHD